MPLQHQSNAGIRPTLIRGAHLGAKLQTAVLRIECPSPSSSVLPRVAHVAARPELDVPGGSFPYFRCSGHCGGRAHGIATREGFNNFHLSNLEFNNDHFWVVVLAAYILAGVFLHLTADEWRFFIALRRRHFERLAKGVRGVGLAQAQRSILVESVPRRGS